MDLSIIGFPDYELWFDGFNGEPCIWSNKVCKQPRKSNWMAILKDRRRNPEKSLVRVGLIDEYGDTKNLSIQWIVKRICEFGRCSFGTEVRSQRQKRWQQNEYPKDYGHPYQNKSEVIPILRDELVDNSRDSL